MKTKMYVITTMSNLHVGSGEYNMGVIDNLVQRDVLNNYPNINSSSLKGALREYFESGVPAEVLTSDRKSFVKEVFGSSPKDKKENMQQGKFRFFEANLLSYPVRSDKTPYMRAITSSVIKELLQKIEAFNIKIDETVSEALQALSKVDVPVGSPYVFKTELNKAIVEDFYLKARYSDIIGENHLSTLNQLFGQRLILMNSEDFTNLCDNNHLPVISRNYLENGESKNLWYEEVVPRFSQFYFTVMLDENKEEEFEKALEAGLVQFGGNSTIGYGYSKVQLLTSINLANYEN